MTSAYIATYVYFSVIVCQCHINFVMSGSCFVTLTSTCVSWESLTQSKVVGS
jgi:hypothetical protein